MKQIELTRGKKATVDDDVYEWAKDFKWNVLTGAHVHRTIFYAATNVKLPSGKIKTVLLHLAILGQSLRGLHTDHIDGDGLNCRRENIRRVTRRVNLQNMECHRNGKLAGAHPQKNGKWSATIQFGGNKNRIRKFIGYFYSEIEAHQAYMNFCKELEAVA